MTTKKIDIEEFVQARIHGEIYDAETARVIPNADLKLTYLNLSPGEEEKLKPIKKKANESGEFEFREFFNRALKVEVSSPKYETNSFTITDNDFLNEVAKPKAVRYVFKKDIALAKKHTTLVGKVISKDKKEPIFNADVRTGLSNESVQTDSNGIYHISLKDYEKDLTEESRLSITVTAMAYNDGTLEIQ